MPRSANWAASLLLTGMLVALIAVAVAPSPWFFALQIGAVVAAAGIILWMFPGTPFFAVALANFVAIYTCLFVFFWETNFRGIHAWAAFVGYGLPLIGFLAGAGWRRERIRAIVGQPKLYDDSRIARVFLWLVPMIAIGGATFLVPVFRLDPLHASLVFIAAMAVIALTVMAVSGNVAAFLIESGLLFEEFFSRSARMLVPAFAFLTFYSLIVVVFAAVYRILDRLATVPQFVVQGVAKELSFTESLYFSLVTLATVGYGDIIPATNLTRLLAGFEVVCGILLLLFGVNEIIAHARAGRGRDGGT
ncbi:MAG TPA: ion channel [Alphaproteobacteria bacterium]|jgi:voltage-gated potassium channel